MCAFPRDKIPSLAESTKQVEGRKLEYTDKTLMAARKGHILKPEHSKTRYPALVSCWGKQMC